MGFQNSYLKTIKIKTNKKIKRELWGAKKKEEMGKIEINHLQIEFYRISVNY